MYRFTKKINVVNDENGTAMVEGAILIPVLVTVFVGLFYLYNMYEAHFEAGEISRGCAWEYSQNNCRDVDMPPECKKAPYAASRNPSLDRVEEELKQSTNDMESHSLPSQIGNLAHALLPVSDLLTNTMGIGEEVIVQSDRSVIVPGLFGGGTQKCLKKSQSFAMKKQKLEWTFLPIFGVQHGEND